MASAMDQKLSAPDLDRPRSTAVRPGVGGGGHPSARLPGRTTRAAAHHGRHSGGPEAQRVNVEKKRNAGWNGTGAATKRAVPIPDLPGLSGASKLNSSNPLSTNH